MNYYDALDTIIRQDIGGRGLLPSLPPSPLRETADSLARARRVIFLTGFPVRLADGNVRGETDGPSGTANLAAALTGIGCGVSVITDWISYPLMEAALRFRAPQAMLIRLPRQNTDDFIQSFMKDANPTHLISLERPGKARDGHYHNMRGEIIDDMLTDSSAFLREARKNGTEIISIGDGGNEMGMGTFSRQILENVPFGETICAAECADLTLAGGVSNWWGWGLASLLSVMTGRFLLPTEKEETQLLQKVVSAGGVDGCTKQSELTVDQISLEGNLEILRSIIKLTAARTGFCPFHSEDTPAQQLLKNK